jgi:HEAT repeat protein
LASVGELISELASGDEARAEAAAFEIACLGEAAISPLKGLLTAADPDHRWWAVRALAAMQAPPIALLRVALVDPEAGVRAAAALALTLHPAPDVVAELIHALDDDDSLVSGLAVGALIAIGHPAVPALLERYDASRIRTQIHMMRALAEIRDHRAIKLMMRELEQRSAIVQHWAQAGLEGLGLDMIYLRPS